MQNSKLKKLRLKIDVIDDQIAELLVQRTDVIKNVGKLKKQQNLPIQNPEREQEVIERLSQKTKGKVSKDLIKKLWRAIFQNAYQIEEQ